MGSLPGARAVGRAALLFVGLAVAAPLATGLLTGCSQKAVAAVNGQKLSEKEFAELCETTTEVAQQRGSVGLQVLVAWIRNTILAQEAKKEGVYPSEQELTTRVDAYRRQAAANGVNLEDQLRQQGITLAAFKRTILNSLIMEDLVCKGVTIPDSEVRAEFDKQSKGLTQPEQIEISQITLDSEEKMRKARSDLGANTQFSLVASTHSGDPFAQGGGKVPFPLAKQGMQPGGPVDPKVVDAAFNLKEGQVSDPIKVGANWVIVRLDKRIPEKKAKFEDVSELIRSALRQQKAQQGGKGAELQRTMMTAFQKATVEINRPEYQALQQQIKGAGVGTGGPMPGGPSGPIPAAEGHEGHQHAAPGGGIPSGDADAPPPPPGK